MMEKTPSQINNEKQRTLEQNNSLHEYCTEVSEQLNACGITQKALIDHLSIMGVDNTMYSVKRLFQIIGEAKFGKSETSKFTTKEMVEVEKEVTQLIIEVSKGEVNPIWKSYDQQNFLNTYK